MKEKSVLLGDSFGDKIIDKKLCRLSEKKGFYGVIGIKLAYKEIKKQIYFKIISTNDRISR